MDHAAERAQGTRDDEDDEVLAWTAREMRYQLRLDRLWVLAAAAAPCMIRLG